MSFTSAFEQLPCSSMDFLVSAPGKGVSEPASQMQGDFVLPALPDLLQEPGSSDHSSISEGLDCFTADVSPEDQPVPQCTEQTVEVKHCHNCGTTETPRWACLAQSAHVRLHAEGSSWLHAQSDVRLDRCSSSSVVITFPAPDALPGAL